VTGLTAQQKNELALADKYRLQYSGSLRWRAANHHEVMLTHGESGAHNGSRWVRWCIMHMVKEWLGFYPSLPISVILGRHKRDLGSPRTEHPLQMGDEKFS
jgi:hypothetical protein